MVFDRNALLGMISGNGSNPHAPPANCPCGRRMRLRLNQRERRRPWHHRLRPCVAYRVCFLFRRHRLLGRVRPHHFRGHLIVGQSPQDAATAHELLLYRRRTPPTFQRQLRLTKPDQGRSSSVDQLKVVDEPVDVLRRQFLSSSAAATSMEKNANAIFCLNTRTRPLRICGKYIRQHSSKAVSFLYKTL